MTRKSKPKPKWDDAVQSQRFLEAAEKAEASDDPKVLERAVKMIVPKKTTSK